MNLKVMFIIIIKYKTPNNKYFYKYIHQFSANILLLSTYIHRSNYTDIKVIMETQQKNPIFLRINKVKATQTATRSRKHVYSMSVI